MSICLSLDAIFPVRKLLVVFTVNVVIDNFLNGQCKMQTADYCFHHANEYVTTIVPLFANPISKEVILFNHISHMSDSSFECKCAIKITM